MLQSLLSLSYWGFGCLILHQIDGAMVPGYVVNVSLHVPGMVFLDEMNKSASDSEGLPGKMVE